MPRTPRRPEAQTPATRRAQRTPGYPGVRRNIGVGSCADRLNRPASISARAGPRYSAVSTLVTAAGWAWAIHADQPMRAAIATTMIAHSQGVRCSEVANRLTL